MRKWIVIAWTWCGGAAFAIGLTVNAVRSARGESMFMTSVGHHYNPILGWPYGRHLAYDFMLIWALLTLVLAAVLLDRTARTAKRVFQPGDFIWFRQPVAAARAGRNFVILGAILALTSSSGRLPETIAATTVALLGSWYALTLISLDAWDISATRDPLAGIGPFLRLLPVVAVVSLACWLAAAAPGDRAAESVLAAGVTALLFAAPQLRGLTLGLLAPSPEAVVEPLPVLGAQEDADVDDPPSAGDQAAATPTPPSTATPDGQAPDPEYVVEPVYVGEREAGGPSGQEPAVGDPELLDALGSGATDNESDDSEVDPAFGPLGAGDAEDTGHLKEPTAVEEPESAHGAGVVMEPLDTAGEEVDGGLGLPSAGYDVETLRVVAANEASRELQAQSLGDFAERLARRKIGVEVADHDLVRRALVALRALDSAREDLKGDDDADVVPTSHVDHPLVKLLRRGRKGGRATLPKHPGRRSHYHAFTQLFLGLDVERDKVAIGRELDLLLTHGVRAQPPPLPAFHGQPASAIGRSLLTNALSAPDDSLPTDVLSLVGMCLAVRTDVRSGALLQGRERQLLIAFRLRVKNPMSWSKALERAESLADNPKAWPAAAWPASPKDVSSQEASRAAAVMVQHWRADLAAALKAFDAVDGRQPSAG